MTVRVGSRTVGCGFVLFVVALVSRGDPFLYCTIRTTDIKMEAGLGSGLRETIAAHAP